MLTQSQSIQNNLRTLTLLLKWQQPKILVLLTQTKHLNMWVAASSPWLNLHEWKSRNNNPEGEIIEVLGDKEMTFGEIQEMTGVLKSNLSQHLSLMTSNGILTQRKEGLNMYFKISGEKITIACRMMREVLIDNLKKHQNLIKDY